MAVDGVVELVLDGGEEAFGDGSVLVVVDAAHHLAQALGSNYPEFPDSCLMHRTQAELPRDGGGV